VTEDDAALWARQRAGQRSAGRALVRIAARPHELAGVLRAAERAGATLVGRAALGITYVEVEPDAVELLLPALPSNARSVFLDSPDELRESVAPWGEASPALLELMRRVKARFDPAYACNPGLFVGGI
jgi:glycolate oxidase FAD binding subunit